MFSLQRRRMKVVQSAVEPFEALEQRMLFHAALPLPVHGKLLDQIERVVRGHAKTLKRKKGCKCRAIITSYAASLERRICAWWRFFPNP